MKSLTPDYIRNPLLPLTITVIGAGGTGSMFLQHLARVCYAYQSLFARRIVVVVVDGDTVTPGNVGRQAFGENEVFHNKAQLIVGRINRFYGFEWLAKPHFFVAAANEGEFETMRLETSSNIIVTCVDNLEARRNVYEFIKLCRQKQTHEYYPYFWIDIGNTKTTGNVIVESAKMEWPSALDVYKDNYVDHGEDEPSCSLAMALNKQDLFINSQCALVAAKWLWELLSNTDPVPHIAWRGAFINLETFNIKKLKVNATEKGDNDEQPSVKPRRQRNRAKVRADAAQKGKDNNRPAGRRRQRNPG
jgi:PRTRC genetic system ThiF family protein